MQYIIINNLKLIEVKFIDNLLVAVCVDLGKETLIKSYYMPFNELYNDSLEENIKEVMQYGNKYAE